MRVTMDSNDHSRFSVSAIIRTRNRPWMLARALDSVAAQTWPHREAVVVNDGGSSVASLVEGYADRLRVRLIEHAPDASVGRCAAANEGVAAARTAFVAYLDDDDLWHPTHCERLMTAARTTGAQVLYTDAEKALERPLGNGVFETLSIEPWHSEDFSTVGFYCRCYLHLSTFCHRQELQAQLGGFDPSLPVLEDHELFHRYALVHPFHHIREITVRFSVRDDRSNAITSMRREFLDTMHKLAEAHMPRVVGHMVEMIRDSRDGLELLRDRVHEFERRITALERR